LIRGVDECLQPFVSGHRNLLRNRESGGIGHVEVVRKEMSVRARERYAERIRECTTDQNAVDESRQRVGKL
jgi:hypothetical protein